MDIISIVMLALGAIGLIGGFLFGKKRGLTKATVRLILVGLAAVLAFLMRETITETVLNTPVDGNVTIIESITQSMTSGEDADKMKGFVNIITNVLTMVLQIVAFIVSFFVLRIASMILYWIIAAVIKSSNKRKVRQQIRNDVEGLATNRKLSRKQRKLVEVIKIDQELLTDESLDKKVYRRTKKQLGKNEKKLTKKTVKRDRKKWLGALVGTLQGALVVICVVGPISGLVSNLSSLIKSLSELEIEGEKLLDEEASSTLEDIGVFTYPETTIAKVYDVTGGWLYRTISTVKNEDGTTTNIESQIEAVDGGVKMVDAVSKLTEVNFENGFDENAKDELVNIFNDLDEIKNDMSEESVQELDRLMKDALTPMLGEAAEELPIDLEKINFADVDFATEGEVISSFYDLYAKTESSEEIDEEELIEEVVTTLSESTLILPVLSQMVEELPEDEKPNFNEEEKAQIEEIINGLENTENVDALKALFGLN